MEFNFREKFNQMFFNTGLKKPILIKDVALLLSKLKESLGEVKYGENLQLDDYIAKFMKEEYSFTKIGGSTGEPRTDSFNLIFQWINSSIDEKSSPQDKATISETAAFFMKETQTGLWDTLKACYTEGIKIKDPDVKEEMAVCPPPMEMNNVPMEYNNPVENSSTFTSPSSNFKPFPATMNGKKGKNGKR